MQRRRSKVALSLHDVRSAFEQQQLLSVRDALAIIHEAQDALTDEPNMVVVQGASTYGAPMFGDALCAYEKLRKHVDALTHT